MNHKYQRTGTLLHSMNTCAVQIKHMTYDVAHIGVPGLIERWCRVTRTEKMALLTYISLEVKCNRYASFCQNSIA
jgi:hypothetical protein